MICGDPMETSARNIGPGGKLRRAEQPPEFPDCKTVHAVNLKIRVKAGRLWTVLGLIGGHKDYINAEIYCHSFGIVS